MPELNALKKEFSETQNPKLAWTQCVCNELPQQHCNYCEEKQQGTDHIFCVECWIEAGKPDQGEGEWSGSPRNL